jgi:hypothetical protein
MIDQQRSLLSPEKRIRDVLAEGGDWVDVRGEKKHVQGYLKDFLFDPGLIEARVGTLRAANVRAFAGAGICAHVQPAGAGRADQRS